jgi:hypothetical protein
MAKLNKKVVDNVLNDFKDSLFISSSLKKFSVNHYDFFEYLKNNDESNKEYLSIEECNNLIKEDQIAEKVYNGQGSATILLEMIKANNKKKYVNKAELEIKTEAKNFSDTELDEKIKFLTEKLLK